MDIDIIMAGAGPAGASAAYWLRKAGKKSFFWNRMPTDRKSSKYHMQ